MGKLSWVPSEKFNETWIEGIPAELEQEECWSGTGAVAAGGVVTVSGSVAAE